MRIEVCVVVVRLSVRSVRRGSGRCRCNDAGVERGKRQWDVGVGEGMIVLWKLWLKTMGLSFPVAASSAQQGSLIELQIGVDALSRWCALVIGGGDANTPFLKYHSKPCENRTGT